MTVRWNFHTHTDRVDGKNTAEEMAFSAMEKGFIALGFSEHAHTRFDAECGMTVAQTRAYIVEIRALKEKYRGRLNIYLGLENDSCDPQDGKEFDYSIGSVHWLKKDGVYYPVDDTPEKFAQCAEVFGGGLNAVKAYYEAVAQCAQSMRPDILGHMDLIRKFNGDGRFFDEESKGYRDMAIEALDAVLDAGCILEVNTGGMARGWRKDPYPAEFLLRRALEKKAPLILSSDAHSAQTIDFAFPETEAMLKGIGFREVMNFDGNFFPVRI